MATTPETSKQTTKDEAAELPRCQCGCGQVRNPKRQFVMGHDAKLKSRLLAQWDAGQGADAEQLVERGWYSWEELEARREKIEAREKVKREKAAKVAEAKAAAERKTTTKAEAAEPPARPEVTRGRTARAATTSQPATA